jgi:predicted membrane channel-forming protein YqfA (hemolysin III family)
MDNIMTKPKSPPPPSWRKPAGMFAILMLIALVAVVLATFSAEIGRLPMLVQAVIYLIAGVIWIAPLRPLLIWMETGKWRE